MFRLSTTAVDRHWLLYVEAEEVVVAEEESVAAGLSCSSKGVEGVWNGCILFYFV